MKGSLIKQHRKFKNLTLEGLASGICSVSYLSKIEHNTILASEEIYQLLGERLNIKLTNINQEFDESIYQNLIDWHEAIHLKDYSLMEELKENCQRLLRDNFNIELTNLFKIIAARHNLTLNAEPLSPETIKKLNDIFPQASKEFQFFYYKTVGVHFILKPDIKESIHHLEKAKNLMDKLPLEDNEVYYHLALSYSKRRSAVESNYYSEMALEGYRKSLQYSKIIETYMLIAINYRYLNIHSVAEEYYLKILKISKFYLDPSNKRRIYQNLGFIYIKLEKYDDALYVLQKTKELETKDPSMIIATIYLLASAHYYKGHEELCWEYIREGVKEADQQDQLFFQHKFYILQHTILETTHEDAFLEKLEQEIIPDFRRLNEYEDYKNYLEVLANLYYNKRMYKKSSMYFREANNYRLTQKKDLL